MPILPGRRLGPYEILSSIGAGGMGEVYRARDTKLSRDVALKVLPDAFAHDPDRLARFRREAQVLASLNHPNIAQIYGVEDHALVMELVEGQSPKGPLPFDEAWKIASQLAELEARELSQIERALTRIRQGTYGLCEHCQTKIPVARLNALPYSTTCVKCQREMELSGNWPDGDGKGNWDKVSDGDSPDQPEIDLNDLEMDLSK